MARKRTNLCLRDPTAGGVEQTPVHFAWDQNHSPSGGLPCMRMHSAHSAHAGCIVSLTLLVYAAKRHHTRQPSGKLVLELVVDVFMSVAWLAAAILIVALLFNGNTYETVAMIFSFVSCVLYACSAGISNQQHQAELVEHGKHFVAAQPGPNAV